jgi:diguanylate cyclase (GGDEF)-like protein/PAS domain S-box-containing protein
MTPTACSHIINDNCYVTKTNLDGIITFANDNFCKISGYLKDELIGSSFCITEPKDEQVLSKQIFNDVKSGKTWKGVLRNSTKYGNDFFMDTSIYPVKNEHDQIEEIITFGNDLTHYIDLITYDQLTGLKNRESLKKDIDNEKHYMCVVINLDNFSDINEFYGGVIGDKVVVETANRLQTVFKGSGIYRLQGDEFAILKLLPQNYKNGMLEEVVKNKLKSIFDAHFLINDIEIHLTATAGVSIGDIHSLRNANLAFKDAKAQNLTFKIFDESMLEQFANFTKNKKVAADIKTAIKEDQIVPYYQPIIDNKTGKIVKYEALARLIKDDDVIPPGAFIDISKKIKYYHEITRAMLIRCFKDFGEKRDIGISINLTIEDIANVRTFNLIIELLANNKYNDNITFELVESDGIEDFELFNKFLTTIKTYGAKISIDDFGTGYSNFSYLSKIEPDFLKIDGSLIKNINNSKDFDVVKTIIDFAKMYHISTVAEFVENEDIYILVKELGIDYSQGYYFSKPLAIENIA